MVHTVTSGATPAAFSELQVPANGLSPPIVFNTPGTFPFFCSIHGVKMQNGMLTVTP
jgi:plastocyanin